MAQILEALMVISFGLSWPFNVYKSIKSKSTKGKSLPFLILIDIGYLCGIAGKIISGNIIWWILILYIINTLMVTTDLIIYFINRRREQSYN